jgi:NADP-dependent 3-hydroxy acid dehydrogenase YdfG
MKSDLLFNRVAVVTGASAGIGEATSRLLVAEGAKVVINARRKERLDALCTDLNREGVCAVSVPGDCSKAETIQALIRAPRSAFGKEADIFVVNAGRGLGGSLVSSDVNQWEEVFRTNISAALLLMREAAKVLSSEAAQEKWPGQARDIIVLGSVVGKNISPFSSLYGTSKFAIGSAAEALRRELGPKGIRVTLIKPAVVVSEFQGVAGYDAKWFSEFEGKAGPFLQPQNIAEAIRFIVSQPAHVHINDLEIRATRQDYP